MKQPNPAKALLARRKITAGGATRAILAKKPASDQAEHNPDGTRRRFSRFDTDPRAKTETPTRTLRRQLRTQAATRAIGTLPAAGEELVLILGGAYHGWDFVAAVLHLAKCPIDHLHVATLGFNKTQARQLGDMIDAGQIRRVTMIVSELFAQANRAEFGLLLDELTRRGQTLANTRNHCKLLCFRLADGRTLSLHGSLNLRRCNAYEQAALSADPALYRFFTDFIATLANDAQKETGPEEDRKKDA